MRLSCRNLWDDQNVVPSVGKTTDIAAILTIIMTIDG